MFKKIVSVILLITIISSTLPVIAAKENEILFSEDFSTYADNELTINTLNILSGVDSRVITDDGDKAFYARTFGEGVIFSVSPKSSNASKTVMSIRLKITGGLTSGKLFRCSFGGTKVDFISINDDGTLRLYDNTVIGGMPKNCYRTISIMSDWKKKIFCVYVDKRCVAHNWEMPSTMATKSPESAEFSLDFNGEIGDNGLFVDEICFQEGNTLPQQMKYTPGSYSSEVKQFDTSASLVGDNVKIIKDLEFNSSPAGVSTNNNSSGQISLKTESENNGYLHFYADEGTVSGAYADISEAELGSQAKYVIDMRLKINDMAGSSTLQLFDGKDKNNTWVKGYTINASGTLSSYYGGTVEYLNFGEWIRLSFAYNNKTGKTEIYINGEHTADNSFEPGTYPVIYRMDCINVAGSKIDVMVDWIRIYTGSLLQEDSFFASSGNSGNDENTDASYSVMDPQEKLKSALSGKTVIMKNNETIYIGGAKQSYANQTDKPLFIDGTLMISQSTIEAISGGTVDYDQSKEILTASGRTLQVAAVQNNGIAYFPLRTVCEQLLGKKVDWDERGFAVISDDGIDVRTDYHYVDRTKQWYPIDLIYRYMQFDNPSGAEIVNAVKSNHPNKSHPRVYFTYDDVDYILDKIDSYDDWKSAYASAISSAKAYLGKDFSADYSIADSGKQSAAAIFQSAITDLATAYLLTGEENYAAKGVELMKGFASWETMGWQTAELTSGHWAAGMGIGFDCFYNYMMASAQGKEDLQYIKNRILALTFADHIPAYRGEGGPRWITLQDNFLGVIGGGLMTLVLAVCDEEDMQDVSEYLAENVLKSLYIAAELYYPNGGYFEGVSYSAYMFQNLSIGVDGLFRACGTDYGLGSVPGFDRAGDYFAYLQTPDGRINFHDDPGAYSTGFEGEFIGYRYNDPVQSAMSHKRKILAGSKYHLRSLYYYYKGVVDKNYNIDISEEDLDRYFYAGEVGGFRNSFEVSDPTFVGFHGGWTNIPHDMLDLGEFVFVANGVVWAMDLGSDNYNLPNYFQTEGYLLYRKRPEGENCVVINPKVDPTSYYGQKLSTFAKLIDIEMNKPKGAKAAYDLTDAYSRDVDTYIRGYYFGDDRNTLTVQDEITLKDSSELYWFMHTPAEIEIVSNNQAILTKDGKSLTVDVYCSAEGYELKAMKAEPLESTPKIEGQNANAGISKLAIYYPEVSGDITISVKLSPKGDYIYTPLTTSPISEWKIPDGEVPEKPTFTGIYADGELVDNFLPGARKYILEIPFGTETVPTITAQSNFGEISVEQAESLGDKAVITISSENFNDIVCEVSFEVLRDRPINVTEALSDVLPNVGTPGGLIKPLTAGGFTIPEPENTPDKSIDGDLSTRYAQDGTQMWFEYDLGEVTDIDGVAIAFYDGDIRQTIFELLYSEDGENFTMVYSGRSTGKTKDYETLAIPGKARYIRLVGYGNTAGSDWNSITEFRAYKEATKK